MTRNPATRSDDHPNATDREVRVATRVVRVVLIMAGVVATVVAAVAVALPAGGHRNGAPAQASLAANRTAANKRWASATCTNILAWKNEIAHDESSLLSLGALTRVDDAIAATKRMLKRQDKLGLPPGAQTAPARAEARRLRSEIESRLQDIESVASHVAGGNIAAIATLLTDLQNDRSVAPQVVDELRRVLTIDLGLSLVETGQCRQLVGIPI